MSSDESSSSGSSTNSSDHLEVITREGAANIVTPWRFEPVRKRAESDRDEEDSVESYEQQQDRLQNNEWCICENCTIMDREVECVCCKEIQQIEAKLREVFEVDGLEEPGCITAHPGFLAVCTNSWVLQTAWYQYKQQYGSNAYEGADYKRYRHIAYRQLVRWCWGHLGKEVRVVLPSCQCCNVY